MKVLRVIPSMNPKKGGPSQGIRNSIPELVKLGVENEVLCFDSTNSDFINSDDLIIHAIGPSKGPYGYCSKLESWLKVNLDRFDAVIIHGLWLYNSYGTYRVWRKYKETHDKAPKLFIMPHGMLDPYFQKAKDRKIKAIRNLVFWKLFESKVVNGVDGLLFTCQQELLLARKPFSPYRPKVELNIGYGIKEPPANSNKMLDAFFSKCPELKFKSYLLFISRIHIKKGVDLLIQAYNKMYLANSTIPALVIAGPGLDTDYGKEMRGIAGENIYFPGMLSGNAKWGAFRGCDAFILPSHQENFGIAVVEAMACSKPVIISDQVNIYSEIEASSAGIVIKDSEEGVLNGLEAWFNLTESERSFMQKNAYDSFKRFFFIENTALKFKSTIKKFL